MNVKERLNIIDICTKHFSALEDSDTENNVCKSILNSIGYKTVDG